MKLPYLYYSYETVQPIYVHDKVATNITSSILYLYFVLKQTLFLKYRMSDITDTDIQNLKSLKTSPVSYLVDNTCPSVETVFGKFPIGSPLAYHVNIHTVKR